MCIFRWKIHLDNFNFKSPWVIGIAIVVLTIIILFFSGAFKKSGFKTTLITPMDQIEPIPPMKFSPLSQKIDGISLAQPVVPEEIGLAMLYPQGAGASMSKKDSNSFELSVQQHRLYFETQFPIE